MAILKIRVFKGVEGRLASTVTIPGDVLKFASRLIPKRAVEGLREEGIDLAELVRLAEEPSPRGTILEFEDHDKNERVLVSLE